ncbi:LysM peptidoglycan-binding domain-containing protein [Clostridium cellulovorans]|uniref:Peptidoglycan-binding lysin domain n=1 Tax=Clostridium cellulovorans (strain ATCC 35296 / DSM 3052 / OCM 3 / 743B) TaxID=573061 RepID=D9SMS2_CLOC7|nr:LysM domain-containing protein [Clostridium cellulovorans]ADL49857.1 Peptidoglycan-binding lysin domain [Clostridium cellulovorans 743B]
MTKKKLSIIISFIVILLIGSGVVYYNTYSSISREIQNSTASIKSNSSSVINSAINNTNSDLSSEKTKNDSIATTSDATMAVGIENEDFKFITYKVKSGDTLFSIASEHAPSYTWDSVKDAIINKNSIKDPSLIKAGDEIVIPEEIVKAN